MEYASCIWWQRTLRLWFVWNSISFSYCFGFYFILKFFLPDPFCSFRSLAVFFLAIKDLKWFDVHLVYYWFYFSFSSLTFLALGLYEGLHDAPLLLFFNSLFAWCPSSSFFQFIIMWFLCGCSSSNSNIFDCCNQDALLQKLLNDNYLSEEERYVE
jgi:hypothetical protein